MSVDLRTTYLGLELRSPIVPSASPLGRDIETIRALVDAGAGAVVLPSLFEEQIRHDARALLDLVSAGTDAFAEALTYRPPVGDLDVGPERYARHVAAAKAAVDVPVIASLNGTTPGGWTGFARQLADAGADALELNVYGVAADPTVSSADVEQALLELVDAVRATVTIPIAVKIGPFHSSLAHFARRLEEHGADGIVLFNRFVQPDIDIDRLAVVPGVRLSTSTELLLPLRWTALLRPHVRASLALTTGVHEWTDALKGLLAGADVVMTASAVLRHGPAHLSTFVRGVEHWLEEHDYKSVQQARGSLSSANVEDASAYERAQYVETLLHMTPQT